MAAIIGAARRRVSIKAPPSARLARVPYVGSPLKRPDDPRILTGRGRYVDDIVAAPHGPRRLRAQRPRPRAHRAPRARARRAERPASSAVAHRRRRREALHAVSRHPAALQGDEDGRDHAARASSACAASASRSSRSPPPTARPPRTRRRWSTSTYEPLPAVLSPERRGRARRAADPSRARRQRDLRDARSRAATSRARSPAHACGARRFTIGRHTGVPLEPRGLVADFEPVHARAHAVDVDAGAAHDAGGGRGAASRCPSTACA